MSEYPPGEEPITVAQNEAAMPSEALLRLATLLLRSGVDVGAWTWALLMAAGLNNEKNGIRAQAQVAEKLGRHRALLSHYVREWKKALPALRNTTFSRSEKTVARCRAARKKK